MKRRTIERIGQEDEGGEMKVVSPPVHRGRPPPADRVAIRLDAQPPARRKHRLCLSVLALQGFDRVFGCVVWAVQRIRTRLTGELDIAHPETLPWSREVAAVLYGLPAPPGIPGGHRSVRERMECKRGGKEELKSSGLLPRQCTLYCFIRFVFPCQPLPPPIACRRKSSLRPSPTSPSCTGDEGCTGGGAEERRSGSCARLRLPYPCLFVWTDLSRSWGRWPSAAGAPRQPLPPIAASPPYLSAISSPADDHERS